MSLFRATLYPDEARERVDEFLDLFGTTSDINAARNAPGTTRYVADDHGEIKTTGGVWVGSWEIAIPSEDGAIDVRIEA